MSGLKSKSTKNLFASNQEKFTIEIPRHQYPTKVRDVDDDKGDNDDAEDDDYMDFDNDLDDDNQEERGGRVNNVGKEDGRSRKTRREDGWEEKSTSMSRRSRRRSRRRTWRRS
jgi:hypothetical protein